MTTISIRIPEARRLTIDSVNSTVSAWTRLTSWCKSTWCVVNGGHYKVLHTDPNRMALRCVACGHMSPGWQVGAARLTHRTQTDPKQLRVRRPVAA
jgi:hypothetical protein